MLSPFEVILGFIVVIVAVFLARNQRFHETADELSRKFCQRHNLQFLDGTVMFRGLRFDRRRFHFCRTFRFDYSTNSADRFPGSITLCGEHIQSFHVHPDHIQVSDIEPQVGQLLEL